MNKQKVAVNKFLIKMVQQCPLLYDNNNEDKRSNTSRNECFKNFAILINERFNVSMSSEDVEQRWSCIRKGFSRAHKHGKNFYLGSELQFLKKHLKHSDNTSTITKSNCEAEEDDDEVLNFRDVLRNTLQSQEEINAVQTNKTSKNASFSLNKNSNAKLLKPQESSSAFTSVLQKLRNGNNSLSAQNHNLPQQCTQEINQASSSTSSTVHKSSAATNVKQCVVPQLDEFAKQKQTQLQSLENKLETVVDKSIEYINNIRSSSRDENDDDIFEKTIREVLRTVPNENIVEFVTTIHIIISSFKDQK